MKQILETYQFSMINTLTSLSTKLRASKDANLCKKGENILEGKQNARVKSFKQADSTRRV